jgi:hypothetical protein
MPFLLFERKGASPIELSLVAREELITRIDHDFPPYVHNLPCIYDVVHRKCHDGKDACLEYLARFDPVVEEEPVEEKPIEETPIVEEQPVEPKKKVSRVKKTKTVVSTTD